MFTDFFTTRRRYAAAAVLAATILALAACGSNSPQPVAGMPGMDRSTTPMPSMSTASSDSGHPMATGDGTTATAGGYTLSLQQASAPGGVSTTLRFRIVTDGQAVTAFEPDQTKLMHFYLVRSDLTGYQHVHPQMTADGTWTAPLQPLAPGDYRVYANFIPAGMSAPSMSTGMDMAMASSVVLGTAVTVPGKARPVALPPASTHTTVDGYDLTLTGQATAGSASTLTVTVSKGGAPVRDLQPYLDTYAHLTAIHTGDLAFAHLHPAGTVSGDHGGPTLQFAADLPTAGNWRLFLQFQTGGVLHTAALTITAA